MEVTARKCRWKEGTLMPAARASSVARNGSL